MSRLFIAIIVAYWLFPAIAAVSATVEDSQRFSSGTSIGSGLCRRQMSFGMSSPAILQFDRAARAFYYRSHAVSFHFTLLPAGNYSVVLAAETKSPVYLTCSANVLNSLWQ